MPEFTKHHALYPKRAFLQFYPADLTLQLEELRNQFVIQLPLDLHVRLHQELDVIIPEEIREEDMPSATTMRKLVAAYNRDLPKIAQMEGFIEQLKWLRSQFNAKQKRDRILRNQLILQIHFLERNLGSDVAA